MIKYMLDTNTCIFAIKKNQHVLERILSSSEGELCISSITYAELSHGVEKSSCPEKNRLALILFLTAIQVLPFDAEAAEEYGTIRASLEKQGTPIGPMDLLIAAHAKARGLVVVTNNVREFSRVNNLQLEDWSAH
ncbi:MAG: type II toxin-antitoxin system VapC family toxin [Lachnospiraceae bacterium]|nr:type II toxin-antitoxin system VapC family toxin [Lachnospiraceae bacterium]